MQAVPSALSARTWVRLRTQVRYPALQRYLSYTYRLPCRFPQQGIQILPRCSIPGSGRRCGLQWYFHPNGTFSKNLPELEQGNYLEHIQEILLSPFERRSVQPFILVFLEVIFLIELYPLKVVHRQRLRGLLVFEDGKFKPGPVALRTVTNTTLIV